MKPEDLDLVETGELYNALERRAETLLVVYSMKDMVKTNEQDAIFIGYKNYVSGMGLAKYANDYLNPCFGRTRSVKDTDDEDWENGS